MTAPRYDIVAIGNAIVDVIARTDEAFLTVHGMHKNAMRLIDADTATTLYAAMNDATEVSGGSAANTLAGAAALGSRCGFIGQVADDHLGQVFSQDMARTGIDFGTPARTGEPETARCLIFVTPDGHRTMNTFLGASQFLPAAAIDAAMLANTDILYLEGYLWDPEEPRAAMRRAIGLTRAAGGKIAFTLSDSFVIDRHRADFLTLMDDGLIDILFANEAEIQSLFEDDNFDSAVAKGAAKVPLLIVTRGPDGAIAISGGERASVPAEPIATVVDTTGAGDLFAAGVLMGLSEQRPLVDCLTMGAICAREIISHVGPRPQTDLKALVAARFA